MMQGPKRDRRFKTGYKNNELPNYPLMRKGLFTLIAGILLLVVTAANDSHETQAPKEINVDRIKQKTNT